MKSTKGERMPKKSKWLDLGKVRLNLNDDANESNRQPHFRGILPAQQKIEEGDEIYLAGWINKNENDKITGLYFTLSMPEKEKKKDDDLPF